MLRHTGHGGEREHISHLVDYRDHHHHDFRVAEHRGVVRMMKFFQKMQSAFALAGMYRTASKWAKSRTTQNLSGAGAIVLFAFMAVRYFAPALLPWDADQDQALTDALLIVSTIVGGRWIAGLRNPEKFSGAPALQGMDPPAEASDVQDVYTWKRNGRYMSLDEFLQEPELSTEDLNSAVQYWAIDGQRHTPVGDNCQTLYDALEFGAKRVWLTDGRVWVVGKGWVQE